MARLVNIRVKELRKCGIENFETWNSHPDTLYIGRNMNFYVKGAMASKWKNPFQVKKWGIDESLKKYEEHVRKNLWDSLPELEGKILGCWCDPAPCHGNVLIKLLREYNNEPPPAPSPTFPDIELSEHLTKVFNNSMIPLDDVKRCIYNITKAGDITIPDVIMVFEEIFRDVPAERLKLSQYTKKSLVIQREEPMFNIDDYFLLRGMSVRGLRQPGFTGRGVVFKNESLGMIQRYLLTRQYNQVPK